jgi:hypothetical protein
VTPSPFFGLAAGNWSHSFRAFVAEPEWPGAERLGEGSIAEWSLVRCQLLSEPFVAPCLCGFVPAPPVQFLAIFRQMSHPTPKKCAILCHFAAPSRK